MCRLNSTTPPHLPACPVPVKHTHLCFQQVTQSGHCTAPTFIETPPRCRASSCGADPSIGSPPVPVRPFPRPIHTTPPCQSCPTTRGFNSATLNTAAQFIAWGAAGQEQQVQELLLRAQDWFLSTLQVEPLPEEDDGLQLVGSPS